MVLWSEFLASLNCGKPVWCCPVAALRQSALQTADVIADKVHSIFLQDASVCGAVFMLSFKDATFRCAHCFVVNLHTHTYVVDIFIWITFRLKVTQETLLLFFWLLSFLINLYFIRSLLSRCKNMYVCLFGWNQFMQAVHIKIQL